MTTRISEANLPALARVAAVPAYERSALRAGIVHIGVGNFHRAHQAVYMDDLFALGTDLDWAIVGAGVRESDDAMRRDLAAQDWLTTVVEQEATHASPRVVGAMIDFIAPADTAAVAARLAHPSTRIVSMTITEGGYYLDPATQRFDATHPDIVADAERIEHPSTAFGLIVAALMRRRAAGAAPFTVMSCDNLPGNGHVTGNAVTGLAGPIDMRLADWIRANVAFPSAMVDRITPATTPRERALLAASFGIDDARPVFCEGFRQWVLEDTFTASRPALERVGVTLVSDVEPWERMKIRILNGGHATLAYPAALLDYHFVHDAMADPLLAAFLARVQDDEIIPVVPPVPGTDLHAYRAQVERRFANPQIGDTIRRLCFDGSNRQPKFILPSVADRLQAGRSVDGLALVGALWCRYCHGATESGALVEPNDPAWPRLVSAARAARERPDAWLDLGDLYGDVGRDPRYRTAFTAALRRVWHDGTRAALAAYVGNGTR